MRNAGKLFILTLSWMMLIQASAKQVAQTSKKQGKRRTSVSTPKITGGTEKKPPLPQKRLGAQNRGKAGGRFSLVPQKASTSPASVSWWPTILMGGLAAAGLGIIAYTMSGDTGGSYGSHLNRGTHGFKSDEPDESTDNTPLGSHAQYTEDFREVGSPDTEESGGFKSDEPDEATDNTPLGPYAQYTEDFREVGSPDTEESGGSKTHNKSMDTTSSTPQDKREKSAVWTTNNIVSGALGLTTAGVGFKMPPFATYGVMSTLLASLTLGGIGRYLSPQHYIQYIFSSFVGFHLGRVLCSIFSKTQQGKKFHIAHPNSDPGKQSGIGEVLRGGGKDPQKPPMNNEDPQKPPMNNEDPQKPPMNNSIDDPGNKSSECPDIPFVNEDPVPQAVHDPDQKLREELEAIIKNGVYLKEAHKEEYIRILQPTHISEMNQAKLMKFFEFLSGENGKCAEKVKDKMNDFLEDEECKLQESFLKFICKEMVSRNKLYNFIENKIYITDCLECITRDEVAKMSQDLVNCIPKGEKLSAYVESLFKDCDKPLPRQDDIGSPHVSQAASVDNVSKSMENDEDQEALQLGMKKQDVQIMENDGDQEAPQLGMKKQDVQIMENEKREALQLEMKKEAWKIMAYAKQKALQSVRLSTKVPQTMLHEEKQAPQTMPHAGKQPLPEMDTEEKEDFQDNIRMFCKGLCRLDNRYIPRLAWRDIKQIRGVKGYIKRILPEQFSLLNSSLVQYIFSDSKGDLSQEQINHINPDQINKQLDDRVLFPISYEDTIKLSLPILKILYTRGSLNDDVFKKSPHIRRKILKYTAEQCVQGDEDVIYRIKTIGSTKKQQDVVLHSQNVEEAMKLMDFRTDEREDFYKMKERKLKEDLQNILEKKIFLDYSFTPEHYRKDLKEDQIQKINCVNASYVFQGMDGVDALKEKLRLCANLSADKQKELEEVVGLREDIESNIGKFLSDKDYQLYDGIYQHLTYFDVERLLSKSENVQRIPSEKFSALSSTALYAIFNHSEDHLSQEQIKNITVSQLKELLDGFPDIQIRDKDIANFSLEGLALLYLKGKLHGKFHLFTDNIQEDLRRKVAEQIDNKDEVIINLLNPIKVNKLYKILLYSQDEEKAVDNLKPIKEIGRRFNDFKTKRQKEELESILDNKILLHYSFTPGKYCEALGYRLKYITRESASYLFQGKGGPERLQNLISKERWNHEIKKQLNELLLARKEIENNIEEFFRDKDYQLHDDIYKSLTYFDMKRLLSRPENVQRISSEKFSALSPKALYALFNHAEDHLSQEQIKNITAPQLKKLLDKFPDLQIRDKDIPKFSLEGLEFLYLNEKLDGRVDFLDQDTQITLWKRLALRLDKEVSRKLGPAPQMLCSFFDKIPKAEKQEILRYSKKPGEIMDSFNFSKPRSNLFLKFTEEKLRQELDTILAYKMLSDSSCTPQDYDNVWTKDHFKKINDANVSHLFQGKGGLKRFEKIKGGQSGLSGEVEENFKKIMERRYQVEYSIEKFLKEEGYKIDNVIYLYLTYFDMERLLSKPENAQRIPPERFSALSPEALYALFNRSADYLSQEQIKNIKEGQSHDFWGLFLDMHTDNDGEKIGAASYLSQEGKDVLCKYYKDKIGNFDDFMGILFPGKVEQNKLRLGIRAEKGKPRDILKNIGVADSGGSLGAFMIDNNFLMKLSPPQRKRVLSSEEFSQKDFFSKNDEGDFEAHAARQGNPKTMKFAREKKVLEKEEEEKVC